MGLYWIRVGPKSCDWCPYKKDQVKTQRQESHVTLEAGGQVLQLQVRNDRDCGEFPEARKEHGQVLWGVWLSQHFDLGP